MTRLIKLKNLILDILFPPICLNCKNSLTELEKSNKICDECLSKITIHTTLFCSICRNRLPENKKACHKNSTYLLGAVTDYNDEIRSLIHYFKYQQWIRLSAPLNFILEKYLENLGLREKLNNYIIIPIPLYKDRLKERGFNQSEILAKTISDKLSLSLENDILVRTKETKSQAELKSWDERKENLSGSFSIESPEKIKNRNIILVDDVYTSGSTINEAVKTLRISGAKKIIALVVAKTR